MKHITTLIALALTLGTLVPLAAQTKMTAKEKRTQTRQERKIAQQKVKEQLYQSKSACFFCSSFCFINCASATLMHALAINNRKYFFILYSFIFYNTLPNDLSILIVNP